MSQKTLATILAVVALIIIVLLGSIYLQNQGGQESAEKLNESLQNIIVEEEITIPSSNPASKVIPQVNPIEKANPFKKTYDNPFN